MTQVDSVQNSAHTSSNILSKYLFSTTKLTDIEKLTEGFANVALFHDALLIQKSLDDMFRVVAKARYDKPKPHGDSVIFRIDMIMSKNSGIHSFKSEIGNNFRTRKLPIFECRNPLCKIFYKTILSQL